MALRLERRARRDHPTRALTVVRSRIAAAALCLTACGDGPVGVPAVQPPIFLSATAAPGAHNVLSALVSVRARHADSASVRYRPVGASGMASITTPMVPLAGESATIPVLGLEPAARYVMEVLAHGAGGVASTTLPEQGTGALPADLPRYTAGGADPSPGYVTFAAGRYALVIDNSGRVVWYRRFPDGAGLNFMAQPTGRYTIRPPTPATGDIEPWLELDPSGEVTRTFGCAGGLSSRLHDVLLAPDGSHWILCDETRTIDLTASGGVADAQVTGTVVQHVARGGELLFQWSPFGQFDITDIPLAERAVRNVNWTHGNALDLDADGNLVLSFRNLSEVTKIDVRTGAIIWRMGGRRNQFAFVDAASPAFARQHSARAHAGGLLLLDNLGDPAETRAEHYVVDEGARTVRLARSYGSAPPVVTEIGGTVQPLAGGRTLVTFGTAGRVEEFDATGRLVWRIDGHAGYVFRAQRIASLYAPGAGTPR